MTAQRCLFPAVLLLLFASPAAAQRLPTAEAAFAEFEAAARAAVTVLNDRERGARLTPVEREVLLAASAELAVALGERPPLKVEFPTSKMSTACYSIHL